MENLVPKRTTRRSRRRTRRRSAADGSKWRRAHCQRNMPEQKQYNKNNKRPLRKRRKNDQGEEEATERE